MDVRSASVIARVGSGEPADEHALLGRAMLLLASTIAVLAAGAAIGTATGKVVLAGILGGVVVIVIQGYGAPALRAGALGVGLLYAGALLIGLGIGAGTVLVSADPTAFLDSAWATALLLLGLGAAGFAIDERLAQAARLLAIVLLCFVVVAFVALLVTTTAQALVVSIAAASCALAIWATYDFVREPPHDQSAIWLAVRVFATIAAVLVVLAASSDGDKRRR